MAAANFTETITIDAPDSYPKLITNLRRQLAVTGRFAMDRPILPAEVNPPQRWFHVVLHAGDHTATLACRGDNVYLVGFRTQAGVWHEFGNGGLIPGSQPLGFGENYTDLIGHADNLMKPNLGKQAMKNAVSTLSGYNNNVSRATLIDALVVLILMVCEASRFISISDHVTSHWSSAGKIDKKMAEQVKAWTSISKALLLWNQNPNARIPTDLSAAGIKIAANAKAVLALVKNVPI